MADFVYEVSCNGERGLADAVRTWSDAVAIPAWTALPGLSAIDTYVMATSGTHDPFVDDEKAPANGDGDCRARCPFRYGKPNLGLSANAGCPGQPGSQTGT